MTVTVAAGRLRSEIRTSSGDGRLPHVTAAFWVMKVAATTLGETAGDLFAQTLGLGYFLTTAALFALFVMTLAAQLISRRYHPFRYWTVILSTSMAGTTMSDFMNRDSSARYLDRSARSLGWGPQGLGLGYPAGAAMLVALLLAVFAVWKLTGLTFSIRRIDTFRGECLFWAAILVSNTLGTSMGDFLSDSSGLGYAASALLITGLLALLLALRAVPAVSNVALFWLAFVLTRPLGATVGDFLTKPVAKGGLALGTAGSSALLLALLVAMVSHATLRERRARWTAPPASTTAVLAGEVDLRVAGEVPGTSEEGEFAGGHHGPALLVGADGEPIGISGQLQAHPAPHSTDVPVDEDDPAIVVLGPLEPGDVADDIDVRFGGALP
nr:hypothetical protein [Frankia canadensis]